MSHSGPASAIVFPQEIEVNSSIFDSLPPRPPSRDGSIMSEDWPHNPIPARITRSQLPAGRNSKPKSTSLLAPYDLQGSKLNAPQKRHDHDGQAVLRTPGSVVDPYCDVESSSQSHPLTLQQVQQVPAALVDGSVKHGSSAMSRESLLQRLHTLRLERRLEELSLHPRTAEQQGYVGRQYPAVYAQSYPDPMDSEFFPHQLSLYPRTAEQQGYVGRQYPAVYAQSYPDPMDSEFFPHQRQPYQQYYGRGQVAQAVPLFHPEQTMFSHQQQQPIHQPQRVLSSRQQQHPIHQPQQVSFPQQQQQPIHHPQQGLMPQQQQRQPSHSPIQLQPGTQGFYRPATEDDSRAVVHQQKYGGASHSSEVGHSGAAIPTPLGLDRLSMEHAAVTASQAVVDQPQTDSSTFDGSQEQLEKLKRASSGSSAWQQPSLSRWYQSATPVRQSEVAADSAREMLPRESLESDIKSSTELDGRDTLNTDVNESDSSSIDMSPVPRAAVSVFAELRGDLKQLQADIEDLNDGSDSSPGSSGSESETLILSEQRSNHTRNNVREETGAGSDGPQDLRTNNGDTANLSNGSSAHKRSSLDGDKEDRARAEIAVSRKRNKLSSSRFICCFHNGPGRECSGTDDSISEVLKKLSEQHETHVCDRCWVLKTKDESSGRFVHPKDNHACLDHCLSPQCHKSSSTIGHRHLFDQNTCGTKTSRVRPGDSEAVYRFIFRLVHPELDCPASVLTTEHSLHLDAVPRQSRRKLNREELTARANDLGRRLEIGEQENAVNVLRITHLEQELANAHLATARAEEKYAQLEKQTRRIVAMLSDALRTGVFLDSQDHQSLLRRVEEDAPGALIHQSKPLLTPSASDRSRNSSATPVRGDMAEPDPFSHPVAREGSNYVAPLQAISGNHTTDGNMSDPWSNEPNMDRLWGDIFDEPGDSDITSSEPHRSDRW